MAGEIEKLLARPITYSIGFDKDGLAGSKLEDIRPEQFGAVGDGITDDTLAVQAAINAAQSRYSAGAYPTKCPVYLNAKVYAATTLNVPAGVVLIGVASGQKAFGTIATVLRQLPTATDDFIKMAGSFQGLKDVTIWGCGSYVPKSPRSITSVASRTSFVVASLIGSSAFVNDSPEGTKGWCSLWSQDNRYLGFGRVQSVNTTTGQVDLVDGWDIYATIDGNTLRTIDKIVFAEWRTVTTDYFGSSSDYDASSMGYSGVTLNNTAGVSEVTLDGVEIDYAFVGLRLNSAELTYMNEMRFRSNALAAVASFFNNADHFITGTMIIQGYSYSPPGVPADTNTYVNRAYKHCGFGFLGRIGVADIDQILIDSTVFSWMSWQVASVNIGIMHLDTPVLDAFVHLYGLSTVTFGQNAPQGFVIGTLAVKAIAGATVWPVPSDRDARLPSVIRAVNANSSVRIAIANLVVGELGPGASNLFASVVRSVGKGLKVHIATVERWESAAATFLSASAGGNAGEVIARYANGAIARIRQADFNTTDDQAIHFLCTRRIVRRITIGNAPFGVSLSTARGGIYIAPAKASTAIVAATQAYSQIVDDYSYLDLTMGGFMASAAFAEPRWYLSLTTPEGAADKADLYVFGDILEQA